MIPGWRAVWAVLRQVIDDADRKNAGLISAGVAFYGLFAVFPGIAALIALFGLLADPEVVAEQLQLLADFMPEAAFALLSEQVGRLLGAGSGTLGWATLLSIGLALWSARAGVAALIRGLNAIFERPNRSGIRHVLVALSLTLCLIGMAIVALLAVVVAPVAIALIPPAWVGGSTWPLEVVRWSVALLALILALGLIYRYGPNRREARLRWFTPGALFVIFAWFAVSFAFSFYVANFGSYNEVYGSLGAVIALLMWLYLSAYLVLLGAALNRALDRPTA